MTVVVDASVLVAALVDAGREGKWAESVLSANSSAAPELALVETSNILRRLEQAGQISRLEAASSYRDLLRLDLELFPFSPFAERIWALRGNLTSYDAWYVAPGAWLARPPALRGNLTSYDAWYVALAEGLDCPLMTLDGKLSRTPGALCEFMVPPHAPRRKEKA